MLVAEVYFFKNSDHDGFIAESGLDLNHNANTVAIAGKVMDSQRNIWIFLERILL